MCPFLPTEEAEAVFRVLVDAGGLVNSRRDLVGEFRAWNEAQGQEPYPVQAYYWNSYYEAELAFVAGELRFSILGNEARQRHFATVAEDVNEEMRRRATSLYPLFPRPGARTRLSELAHMGR